MDVDTNCQKLLLKVVLKEPHPNKMDRDTFLNRLSEIQVERDKALQEYNIKIGPLDEKERKLIDQYIEANARFKMGEKVLVNKPIREEENWTPCFIGWRELRHKDKIILYRLFGINKDGSPSKTLSSFTYPEDLIKKFTL